jgi:hypothetical protein
VVPRCGLLYQQRIHELEAIMVHLADKHFVQRANTVLVLGILWSALAICVLGPLFYGNAF